MQARGASTSKPRTRTGRTWIIENRFCILQTHAYHDALIMDQQATLVPGHVKESSEDSFYRLEPLAPSYPENYQCIWPSDHLNPSQGIALKGSTARSNDRNGLSMFYSK